MFAIANIYSDVALAVFPYVAKAFKGFSKLLEREPRHHLNGMYLLNNDSIFRSLQKQTALTMAKGYLE